MYLEEWQKSMFKKSKVRREADGTGQRLGPPKLISPLLSWENVGFVNLSSDVNI